MSAIESVFTNHTGFIGYLTAGDGGLEHTYKSALALIKGGVNILEIGMPFSDPIADGPIIEMASQRALNNNTTLENVIEVCAKIRNSTNTPIILYSYYNPIFTSGESFYQQASRAGINGVLVVDLPFDESTEHLALCKKYNLDPIFLVSPTTPVERIKQFNQHAKGMLYYVCRNGTTGVKQSLPSDFEHNMKQIKQNTHLPVVAGLGISNKTMAADVISIADGFVVGSLFVNAAHKHKDYAELTKLASSLNPKCAHAPGQ